MQELLRALAIAWKNLAAYPAGHPALEASLGLAHQRLRDAVAGGALVFGVARDGLLCAGETLTSSHARELARALYLREVAVLRLEAGLERRDLEGLLRALASDGTRGGRPALAEELSAQGVAHVQVEGVDFSRVRLLEGTAPEAAPPTLWEDLLGVLLSGGTLSAEGRRLVDSGEAASARGLAAVMGEVLAPEGSAAPAEAGRGAAGAADARRALGARLVQAATKHLQGGEAEREQAASQVAELLRALPPDVRETLVAAALRSLATDESSASALGALAGRLDPDTVLQALSRIKDEVPLSSHALRLMHALSTAAPRPQARSVQPPDPALLAELSVLFREDDIDRYNPEEHQSLLEQAAIDVPVLVPDEEAPALGERLEGVTEAAVGERVAEVGVELLFRFAGQEGTEALLGRLEALFRGFLSSGRLLSAATLVEDLRAAALSPSLPAASRAGLEEALARMATAESVTALVDAFTGRGAAAALARRLMDALGGAAARGLLVALAEEKDKSRRRRILDLVVSLGPVIAGPARALLSDPRWYVVRNMIVLLQKVGDRTALPEVRRAAEHPDLRVRLEAIKWLLAHDPEVPRGLLEKAIHDPDPKLAEAAVALAGSYGIKEAVGPLLAIVDNLDLLGRRRSLRLKALKALGDLADPAVLPRLARYFRQPLLPLLALEERRAAFATLASYPEEVRRPYVEIGLRARDPGIRALCGRLRAEPPAAPAAEAG